MFLLISSIVRLRGMNCSLYSTLFDWSELMERVRRSMAFGFTFAFCFCSSVDWKTRSLSCYVMSKSFFAQFLSRHAVSFASLPFRYYCDTSGHFHYLNHSVTHCNHTHFLELWEWIWILFKLYFIHYGFFGCPMGWSSAFLFEDHSCNFAKLRQVWGSSKFCRILLRTVDQLIVTGVESLLHCNAWRRMSMQCSKPYQYDL